MEPRRFRSRRIESTKPCSEMVQFKSKHQLERPSRCAHKRRERINRAGKKVTFFVFALPPPGKPLRLYLHLHAIKPEQNGQLSVCKSFLSDAQRCNPGWGRFGGGFFVGFFFVCCFFALSPPLVCNFLKGNTARDTERGDGRQPAAAAPSEPLDPRFPPTRNSCARHHDAIAAQKAKAGWE